MCIRDRDSGDTITIPAGATITNNGTAAGFGATGAASWDTTVKTTGFTAVSGVGYFVNTTGGAISVNLPTGTAGAVVAIKDYANTFDTNAVTLVQNGSDKIGGSTVNATLSTEGLAVTLVFIDSTQGWLVTDNGTQDTAPTAQYVTATGGTITECGNFKIHKFTGPGTFCVSNVGNAAGSTTVDYLVVAGGASGGIGNTAGGAGGGAGGVRVSPGTASGCWTASPLGASPAVALPVAVQGYPIAVGAGGAGKGPGANGQSGNCGSVSTFSTITSTGGGKGAGHDGASGPGGSGGGGSPISAPVRSGGSGNTPPVSPPQGNNGGDGQPSAGSKYPSGGGGGAAAVGTKQPNNCSPGGPGGAGIQINICGSNYYWAGGGAGSGYGLPGGDGGIGGGGGGSSSGTENGGGCGGAAGGSAINTAPAATPVNGGSGAANSGSGGGGAVGGGAPIGGPGASGSGGSGIVIIRYKFQN